MLAQPNKILVKYHQLHTVSMVPSAHTVPSDTQNAVIIGMMEIVHDDDERRWRQHSKSDNVWSFTSNNILISILFGLVLGLAAAVRH